MFVDSFLWVEELEGEKLLLLLIFDEGEVVDFIVAFEGERLLGLLLYVKLVERFFLETLDSDEEVSFSDEILVFLSGGFIICEFRLLFGMEW